MFVGTLKRKPLEDLSQSQLWRRKRRLLNTIEAVAENEEPGLKCLSMTTAANSDLTHHILPPRFRSTELPHVEEAIKAWSSGLDIPPPSGPASHHQKAWDVPKVSATADTLLKQAPDAVSCSCLLAASTRVRCMAECPSCLISGIAHGQ